MTLTHQRDPVRVTAERGYVLLDPVQGGDKVEQSVVARRVAVLRAQETFEHTHTHTHGRHSAVITFRVRRSRGKMYWTRQSVCMYVDIFMFAQQLTA